MRLQWLKLMAAIGQKTERSEDVPRLRFGLDLSKVPKYTYMYIYTRTHTHTHPHLSLSLYLSVSLAPYLSPTQILRFLSHKAIPDLSR